VSFVEIETVDTDDQQHSKDRVRAPLPSRKGSCSTPRWHRRESQGLSQTYRLPAPRSATPTAWQHFDDVRSVRCPQVVRDGPRSGRSGRHETHLRRGDPVQVRARMPVVGMLFSMSSTPLRSRSVATFWQHPHRPLLPMRPENLTIGTIRTLLGAATPA